MNNMQVPTCRWQYPHSSWSDPPPCLGKPCNPSCLPPAPPFYPPPHPPRRSVAAASMFPGAPLVMHACLTGPSTSPRLVRLGAEVSVLGGGQG
jgi:hypothetical protein